MPALLLQPAGAPRGVVLYCHAHGNRFEVGKEEVLLGRPGAAVAALRAGARAPGHAVLAIDHWGFGERREPSERALVKRLLWHGDTLWGWRVHDTLAALDWLRAQPAFEALPVLTLGLSMGSTMALWAAALDERIAGCIELCCAAEYDALLRQRRLRLPRRVLLRPGILRARLHAGRDRRARSRRGRTCRAPAAPTR